MNRLRTFDPALLMRILSISCFTMLQYFLSMATWFVFFVAVERLGQRELAIANIVRSILCRIADSGQRTGYDYQQSCQQCYWCRRHPARDAAH